MLSQHGVQAHVNGHLHSAFGQRVHMLHKTKVGGMLVLLGCALLRCATAAVASEGVDGNNNTVFC